MHRMKGDIMRKEDRVRTKIKVDQIKAKPVQQVTHDETDYLIRKQYIITDIEGSQNEEE